LQILNSRWRASYLTSSHAVLIGYVEIVIIYLLTSIILMLLHTVKFIHNSGLLGLGNK